MSQIDTGFNTARSPIDLDGMVASGTERRMNEGFERLDERLAEIKTTS